MDENLNPQDVEPAGATGFTAPPVQVTQGSDTRGTGTIPRTNQTGQDPTLLTVHNLQRNYNPNGGPPEDRITAHTAGAGTNSRAQGEQERNHPAERQYSAGRNPPVQSPRVFPPPAPGQNNPGQNNPTDMASKEGKFSVLEDLESFGEDNHQYVPNNNEVLFSKMKWHFDGQDSFEDYVVRIGGYARTLGIGEVCFKNTLFQSFRPPCSFSVSDMEPSMPAYRIMNRKEYVQALHERLEPASACDLIYGQFKERTQKAGEVYDLYLRDKYNLFIRSFPSGKTRIFKDFCESAVRGLHNEILRNKARDFLSIQALNGSRVETFDDLRQIIQISVENIQARTIAGELDAADAIGTDIRLMNYSYTNAAVSREKERNSRYDVNVVDEDAEEIAAFRNFKKFQNQGYKTKGIKGFSPSGRQPAEDDVCYNCNGQGHFSRNCPRKNLPGRSQNVNKVERTGSGTMGDHDEDQDTSSSETDLEIDYVKEKRDPKSNQSKNTKSRHHIYQIVEKQGEQISSLNAKMSGLNTLSKQLSELMSVVSARKNGVNTLGVTSSFPEDIDDINRDNDDDIFNFL